ncbi:hypothetical protein IRJ41_025127, partial [Triplophysa rosa]
KREAKHVKACGEGVGALVHQPSVQIISEDTHTHIYTDEVQAGLSGSDGAVSCWCDRCPLDGHAETFLHEGVCKHNAVIKDKDGDVGVACRSEEDLRLSRVR